MANIYVRKSGSDSNDGSTPALAKLTIAGAIAIGATSDNIYVGAGLYRENQLNFNRFNLYGDITGEQTGDAGEVIISGLNSTDDTYSEVTHMIEVRKCEVKDIIIENVRLSSDGAVLKQNTLSGEYYKIENIKIRNVWASSFDNALTIYGFKEASSSTTDSYLKNIEIDNMYIVDYTNTSAKAKKISGIYIWWNIGANSKTCENIKLTNFKIINYLGSTSLLTNTSTIYGLDTYNDISWANNILNIEMTNFVCSDGNAEIRGIYCNNSSPILFSNVLMHDFFAIGYTTAKTYGYYCINSNSSTTYNCSVFNFNAIGQGTNTNTSYYNTTQSYCVNKANYIVRTSDKISRFSPLVNNGFSKHSSVDIDNNPRPAYGNTNCNIGVSEATFDNVQKESTVKDSGDYSIKVKDCNYFKKTFQVPVTASTLRTVKVKIRIDGTWGTTRPKATLSGQGMTASTSTKNSTTGSFEELTVSGTPTTTGIALLTIEAHATGTDAIMYIDTVTLS